MNSYEVRISNLETERDARFALGVLKDALSQGARGAAPRSARPLIRSLQDRMKRASVHVDRIVIRGVNTEQLAELRTMHAVLLRINPGFVFGRLKVITRS